MTKLRVPFTRSLSLTRNFTLSPDVVVVASSLSLLFTHTKTLHRVFLFFYFFLLLAFINQRTGTNTFFPLLFCLIVYVLLDFFTVVCLWRFEKTWLSNHLLQNLQTGLDHRSISSASTVVVAVDVLEFCRHRHTLEGCRNCC